MTMTRLEILQLIKDLTNPANVVLMEGRKPSPGPLDQLFEKTVMNSGSANIFLENGKHEVKFERYRGTRSEEYEGSLRIVFKNPRMPDRKQVHLEISPTEFQILTLIDTAEESVSHCDTGSDEMNDPSAAVFVAKRADLKKVIDKGGAEVPVETYRLRRVGQIVQVPIYRRPVYNPPPVETSKGKEQIVPLTLPDMSLKDVRMFSEQALLSIITQIDPVIEHGRHDWYLPIELKPTLRPAQEIATLVVQNLGV